MKSTCMTLLLLAVGAFLTSTATAQIVPFKSFGTANEYDPATAEFGGPGQTAHLGASTGGGFAIPSPTDDPLVLDWSGGGEFVAANGAKIFFVGGGQVFLTPLGDGWFTAAWIGEFEITGGTGRFSNVGPGDEPLSVVALNDPFQLDEFGQALPGDIWTYDYEITGTMDLGKKGKKK